MRPLRRRGVRRDRFRSRSCERSHRRPRRGRPRRRTARRVPTRAGRWPRGDEASEDGDGGRTRDRHPVASVNVVVSDTDVRSIVTRTSSDSRASATATTTKLERQAAGPEVLEDDDDEEDGTEEPGRGLSHRRRTSGRNVASESSLTAIEDDQRGDQQQLCEFVYALGGGDRAEAVWAVEGVPKNHLPAGERNPRRYTSRRR